MGGIRAFNAPDEVPAHLAGTSTTSWKGNKVMWYQGIKGFVAS